jgi:hypothetical protein
LTSSAASPLTGTEDLTTPSGDEYDTGNSTPCPEVEVNELTCIVELDDVLEASFLDDSKCEPGLGSSLVLASGATLGGVEDSSTAPSNPSVDSTAVAEASNKHLARWDVISIGAFRQTREQQQQAWGPGARSSSAIGDYGGVIKSGASAAGSALLWQNSGAGSSSTGGAGSSKKTMSIPGSTLRTSTSSSTKAAKRRRLMMASSTMSSPLVLPLSSTSLSTPPSKSHSSPLAAHSHSQPSPSTTNKTRKELRREKKLLKKKTTTSSSPSSSPLAQQPPFFFTTHPYAAHPNNASNNNNHHQFHIHQHHPNSKTRGMSSSQRMGYFGGSMPPLNL